MENKVIINLDEYMEMKRCMDEMTNAIASLNTHTLKSTTGYDTLRSEYREVVTIGEGHVIEFLKKLWECDEVRIIRKGE